MMGNDLLTPHDVSTTWFDTHRMREGYDIDQVDAFLDGPVMYTIRTLARRCMDLEAQLDNHRKR